jgi:hypothetical protein
VKHLETLKAKARARVEHQFRVVKFQVGFVKTRDRGLAKNPPHLVRLFTQSNLYLARRKLAVADRCTRNNGRSPFCDKSGEKRPKYGLFSNTSGSGRLHKALLALLKRRPWL